MWNIDAQLNLKYIDFITLLISDKLMNVYIAEQNDNLSITIKTDS